MSELTDEQIEAFDALEEAINRVDRALDETSSDLLSDWVMVCAWHLADEPGVVVQAYTRPGTPAYRVLGLLQTQVARHNGALGDQGGDDD